MKKMLFSATALVAFSMTSSAQLTQDSITDLGDSLFCSSMGGLYVSEEVRKNPSLTEREQKLIKDAYIKGCLEARRASRVTTFESRK
jgi:hypothetical protein